jgi:hypothetical protein
VNDLWKEELACWRERWGLDLQERNEKEDEPEVKRKMPGSFDW